MRIGIDIDGVLTDIEQWQLDYGSKVAFEQYNKGIITVNIMFNINFGEIL